jgi:hypothetical protein
MLSFLLPFSCSVIPVNVSKDNDKWVLYRNGSPYFIKCAGGFHVVATLSSYGANSVRTWDSQDTTTILNAVKGTDLTVCAGFWFTSDILTSGTKDEIVKYVGDHKEDDAILMWTVGNQVQPSGDVTWEKIFGFIDEVAAAVEAVDANHPVMTVIEDSFDAIKSYLQNLTHIDIIGINVYGGVTDIGSRFTAADIGKPLILSEFGPRGPWEESSTSFGVPIEPSSTKRAETYRTSYNQGILAYKDTICLGGYVFYWGWKHETSPTWFGMFYPDGSRLAPVEVMTELWGGTIGNRAPVTGALTLSKTDGIRVGESITVECSATDPDADELTWSFELVDVKDSGWSGNPIYHNYSNAVESVSAGKGIVKPPAKGQFRVYAVVRDGKGNAAFESLPINVSLEANGDHVSELPSAGSDDSEALTETVHRGSGAIVSNDDSDDLTTFAPTNTGAIVNGDDSDDITTTDPTNTDAIVSNDDATGPSPTARANTGVIVGAVVGGVTAVAIIIIVVIAVRVTKMRRHHRISYSPSA